MRGESEPLLQNMMASSPSSSTPPVSLNAQDAFIRTLIYFEYRKILREFGGSVLNPNRYHLLSLAVFVLWLINFVIYSAQIVDGSLIINFFDERRNMENEDLIYIGGAFVYLLTFILVITAIQWNVGDLVRGYFLVLLVTTIFSVSIKATSTNRNKEIKALGTVQYVTVVLLGATLGNFIWRYDFVPHFVMWRYGRMKTAAGQTVDTNASFPYWACFRFALFLLLILPIWIPLALLLGVFFVLLLSGIPTESIFPLNVLRKMEPDFWSLECVSKGPKKAHSTEPSQITDALLVEQDVSTMREINVTVTYQRKGSLYRGFNRCCGVRPEFFSYKGSCDPNGVPDGYGEWKDSDSAGEFLTGSWREGLPEAPFDSREYLAGGMFQAVFICVAMASDGPVDAVESNPNFIDKNIYSLSSAECCISGQFYSGFPLISYLTDYGNPGGQNARGVDPSQVLTKYLEKHQNLDGHALEAVVFIPGFNSCLDSALESFSQFLTLAGYPDYIIPWCFEWPAKSIFTYYQARDACESMEMHQHLKDFMADLLSIGIARVNFIGHSMGARALVSFLGANSHVFNAPENMQLGAVLLPNPETDLKAFLDASSAISSVAESVTVYADKGDNAIFWAEYANSVFPSPSCKGLPFSFSLGRSVSPLRRQNRAEVANDVETDGLDESDLLDVDVIDTSSVFSNVQKLRHSYFNVSRDILEDIHEVLVSRNRAAQRKARLVKREGNVYGWLQAPPFYVMGS